VLVAIRSACLVLALSVLGCGHTPPPPEPQAIAPREFVPSRDGWNFRNSFTGNPFPDSIRQSPIGPLADRFGPRLGLGVPSEFGLCGGMSAAAADYWLARREPPKRAQPPTEGDPLYEYLRQRNADSMGAAGVMAVKFIEWMGLPEQSGAPGERSTGGLSVAELRAVVERVRANGYATVGLVYVDSRTGKPWENHQVLACRVLESTADRVQIQLYEPNHPGRDDVRLEAEIVAGKAGEEARITQWIGKRARHVRGLFVMPFEARVPPGDL
jgi:hypothetical protein